MLSPLFILAANDSWEVSTFIYSGGGFKTLMSMSQWRWLLSDVSDTEVSYWEYA